MTFHIQKIIKFFYKNLILILVNLLILILCMGAVIAVTSITLNKIRESLIEHTLVDLQSTSNLTNKYLIENIKFHISELKEFTLLEEIKDYLNQLPDKTVSGLKIGDNLYNFIRKKLETVYSGKEFANYYIVSPQNINFFSYDKSLLGKENFFFKENPNLLQGVFSKINKGLLNFFPIVNKSYKGLYYWEPIYNESGKIIAILLAIESLKQFSTICDMADYGETGETYAFDNKGYLLSKSRFLPTLTSIEPLYEKLSRSKVHYDKNLKLSSEKAVKRLNEELSAGYPDYRGIEVFGYWVWNTKYNFGVVSEIDKAETLKPYYELKSTLILLIEIIFLLFLVLLIFINYYVSRSKKLLLQYSSNLETEVKKRTSELRFSQIQTEKQRKLLRATVDSFPYPFFVIDAENYSLMLMNKVAESLKNNRKPTTCYELTHHQNKPCNSKDHPCTIKEIRRTGKPVVLEHIHYDEKGEKRIVEVHGTPIFDDNGNLKQVAEYALDITERKKVLLELQKLSSAVEQGPAVVVITDKEGTIEYVNPYFTKLTGYTSEEAIGQNPRILKTESYPKGFYEELWDTILAKKVWSGEFVNKRKDGTLYTESASISPVLNSDNEIVNFVGVKVDITDKKRAEKELLRLNKFFNFSFEASNTGPWWIDLSDESEEIVFQAVDFTPTILEIPVSPSKKYKFSVWENLMKRIGRVNQKLKAAVDKAIQDVFIIVSGKVDNMNTVYPVLMHNDKIKWILSKASVAERKGDGSPSLIIGILTDITAQIEIQEKYKEAKDKAEEATRAKSEFLAIMSHELKTPMNTILGFNYLQQETKLTNKQFEYAKSIESSAKNLLRVINSILDFSKIEAGKLDIENIKFNLDNMLASVMGIMTMKAKEKGLNLILIKNKKSDICQSDYIGDPHKLEQVLTNLISNSIKFTEKGEIKLIVECIKKDQNNTTLKFTVSDTGIGLKKEQIEKLFQPFQQADSSISRKYGGSGLGLSICKKIIEKMQGKISVESVFGKGSSFHVSIEVSNFNENMDVLHEVNLKSAGISKLRKLLEQYDTEALEYFVELKQSLLNADVDIYELEKNITSYNFEKALKIIKDLKLMK